MVRMTLAICAKLSWWTLTLHGCTFFGEVFTSQRIKDYKWGTQKGTMFRPKVIIKTLGYEIRGDS